MRISKYIIKKLLGLITLEMANLRALICRAGCIASPPASLTCQLAECRSINNPFLRRDSLQPIQSDKHIDLSVVAPLYNSEDYIDRLLEGLVNQKTSFQYEIILIDDGSTDGTYLKASKWRDKYKALVSLNKQENQGIGAARNAGVNLSRGSYIAFIDHDDRINPYFIEDLLSNAIKFDADCSICGYDISTNRNNVEKIYQPVAGVYHISEIDNLYSLGGFVWSGIYRRNLFNLVQFPPGFWYEDIITVPLLYRQCKTIAVIDKVLYHKSEHKTNAARTLWVAGSSKSGEQVTLAYNLIEANDYLGLPRDRALTMVIARELSSILWYRTRRLNRNAQRMVFYLAARVIEEYSIGCNEELSRGTFSRLGLSPNYYDAFYNRDYPLWCLLSRAEILLK